MVFEDDSKDRKRRFLRGLNFILENEDLEGSDIAIRDAIGIDSVTFRDRLAEVYCLEVTPSEIQDVVYSGMTTGEFTEKYVGILYNPREKVDLNKLVRGATIEVDGKPAIDAAKLMLAPKYGMNGSQWCDVSEGPCGCGAWHD